MRSTCSSRKIAFDKKCERCKAGEPLYCTKSKPSKNRRGRNVGKGAMERITVQEGLDYQQTTVPRDDTAAWSCFGHGVVNRKVKDKERPQRYEVITPDLVSAASPPPRARKRPPPSTDTAKPFMSTGKKPFKSPKRSGIVVPAHLRVAYNGSEHDAWAVLDLGDGRYVRWVGR